MSNQKDENKFDLLKAIIAQAAEDLFAEEQTQRDDARNFFASNWYAHISETLIHSQQQSQNMLGAAD
ncbi:MAG: hypothetical protein QNJ45_12365 [Ardenticatenaceae bacterium]|nr:hypothetical protein [Ardenticatenaceae bacterium]